MSIAARWDTPDKTLLIVTCKGKWSGRELSERLDQAWADASTVTHNVGAILDFRFAARLSPDAALALMLALNAMPKNVALGVLLGVTSPLFSAASSVRSLGTGSRTLYAASMQEARSLIVQHPHESVTSMVTPDPVQPTDDSPADDRWLPLLRPFALVPDLTLTTYERNGAAVSTAARFVLQAHRFYVLTTAGSAEVPRLHNNPYVQIALADPSLHRSPVAHVYPARVDLVATAEMIPLDERNPQIATWRQKYNEDLAPMTGQPLVWLDLQPLRLAL